MLSAIKQSLPIVKGTLAAWGVLPCKGAGEKVRTFPPASVHSEPPTNHDQKVGKVRGCGSRRGGRVKRGGDGLGEGRSGQGEG